MNVQFPTDSITEIQCDVLAVGVGTDLKELADLDAAFDGQLTRETSAKQFRGSVGAMLHLPTFGRIGARDLVLVGMGDGSAESRRTAAGRAGREARSLRAERMALHFPDSSAEEGMQLLEAAAAGNYAFQMYKPEDERSPTVESWQIFASASDSDQVQAALKRIRWQGWARDLVNMPPADLYPESLAAKAQDLASIDGVEVEVWDFERCQAEGCVGIVAVGQGSDKPGCLIRVTYRPKGAADHIALVGKGVTFDAGGLSLKPSSGMQTMRCDMGGAATMLAATGAIADLGLPVAVDCFVGAVENMVSGNSYKLGDILRYRNGVTVEIHNTDAEGRLVLADCLIRACEVSGVSTVVDAATLTGAAVVAVGSDFTGLFTHDDGLAGSLLAAADEVSEGLWRLPLHAPYKELLKSDYAQIKNVGGRSAGATTAALFLEHFVKKDGPRWAHLDIAGPAFLDKASTRYAPGGTGQMVRALTTWASQLG
ncbi:MAG: leucyl aminopeptidase [Myxococcales bacterium]|nr:leucyl aminopeptidase [Myxococcales bacterium]